MGGQCYSERPAHNEHCFILSLYYQKETTSLNAARHEIYRNRRNPPPLKSLPIRREPGITRAESPFANAVMEGGGQIRPSRCRQQTDYGWEVEEHEKVMPAISREPAVPSKLMDVIRCSCKAEGKLCIGRCSYVFNGMSCTSYCVREGGMLAVTHILNRRRTKATHN